MTPRPRQSTREQDRQLPDPAGVAQPWLDAYPPGVPATYDYPLVAATRLLDDASQDFPDTVALEYAGYTLTYRHLHDRVDRLASALAALGVGRGDRVALLLPDCPQHVIAFFAVLRLGAVVVTGEVGAPPGVLEHRLNDAGCTVVVCSDPAYRALGTLKGRLRTVQHIISTSLADYLSFPRNVLFGLPGRRSDRIYAIPESEGVLRFKELVDRTAPTVAQATVEPAEGLAVLAYQPRLGAPDRGVMLTHLNLLANAFQLRLWIPDVQAGRETILCASPLAEPLGLTGGLLLGMLSAAKLTLTLGFDPPAALKAISAQGATLLIGPPQAYRGLVDAAGQRSKHDLGSLRVSLSVGPPMPLADLRAFEQLTGGRLREAHGVPEATAVTHANPVYGRAKLGTGGLPVTDTRCILVDPADPSRPSEPGTAGRLAVHGPQVMRGYWQRPEDTAAMLRDGWLLTRHMAEIDDDGYLRVRSGGGEVRL